MTITKAATCTAAGSKVVACTNDGCSETKTETIPALGHDYDDGEVTTAATCTTDGVKTYTCKRDGTTKTESIPALKHEYIVTASKDVTCTEDGYTTYTCANCGDSYTDTVKATGHVFADKSGAFSSITLPDGSPLSAVAAISDSKTKDENAHDDGIGFWESLRIKRPTSRHYSSGRNLRTFAEWQEDWETDLDVVGRHDSIMGSRTNSLENKLTNYPRHYIVGVNDDGSYQVYFGTIQEYMELVGLSGDTEFTLLPTNLVNKGELGSQNEWMIFDATSSQCLANVAGSRNEYTYEVDDTGNYAVDRRAEGDMMDAACQILGYKAATNSSNYTEYVNVLVIGNYGCTVCGATG